MQEIIKPDNGVKEIDAMRVKIHTQNIQFKKLKQELDKVIKNMEMAVERTDYIKVKYPVDNSASTARPQISLLARPQEI